MLQRKVDGDPESDGPWNFVMKFRRVMKFCREISRSKKFLEHKFSWIFSKVKLSVWKIFLKMKTVLLSFAILAMAGPTLGNSGTGIHGPKLNGPGSSGWRIGHVQKNRRKNRKSRTKEQNFSNLVVRWWSSTVDPCSANQIKAKRIARKVSRMIPDDIPDVTDFVPKEQLDLICSAINYYRQRVHRTLNRSCSSNVPDSPNSNTEPWL